MPKLLSNRLCCPLLRGLVAGAARSPKPVSNKSSGSIPSTFALLGCIPARVSGLVINSPVLENVGSPNHLLRCSANQLLSPGII